MSQRVRGIKIAIDGDTSGLEKALSGVEKNAKKVQRELSDVNKVLKFDPHNTELIAQKMAVLGDAVNVAETKLASLRQAQQEVQAQFDRGEIGADQYRAFQREIADTENSLASYKKQMQSVEDEQANFAKSTQQMQRFFDATGQSIDDFADVLGTNLVQSIKDGRVSSAQLEAAFDEIGRTALGTNANLERLRASLRNMDDGGSLDDVRRDLDEMRNSANEAEESVNKLSSSFGALGGVVGAVGIGGAVAKALEIDDIDAKIDVTFDVPEESKKSVREALNSVKKYGIDGEEALEGVRRQWALNADATDETNAKVIEGAAAVAKSYSRLDFVELVQETNEIAKALEITDEEAINVVNNLLKIGFPDEQLDVIAEYGVQLKRAGFEANEIVGIMASAANVDSFNIDNLLDSLKEARIVASELGLGLSEGFKENLREITNTVKPATDEQLAIMEDGFSKQEDALSKSLSNREKELSKSHDKQKKALEKALSDEYDALTKNYDNQQKALDKSLSAEMKAFEKAANEKMKLLDAEYMAKLKIIDEEKYNKLKAIDDEIAALEGLTEAENKAAQAAVDAEKRAALEKAVNQAKTNTNRKKAEEALAKFDAEMRQKALQEERKDQIEVLKGEKDNVKEAFDEQKEALKSELDLKKEQLSEVNEAEKEALAERQEMQKEAFATQKEAALSALREEQTARKDALSERLSVEAETVREAHQAELESFRKMNDEKLKLAANPPDSAAFTAMESQLKAWGDAIAAGGEKGAQAFKDMIAWLDQMEDGTLKNAIGTELLGTKWEDQGQAIIDAVMGADEALEQLDGSQNSVNDSIGRMNDGNAVVTLGDAFGKLNEALKPIFDVIATIVDAIASLMLEFPVASSIIVGLTTVVGLLGGAFLALAPFIAAIPGALAAVGPAMTAIGGLFTSLSGVILPALGTAFGAISAPLVIAVAAIGATVAILIKYWEPITKFFSDLWDGVVDIFDSAGEWLSDSAQKMGDFVMKPINKMRDSIVGAFEFAKERLSEIWQGIVEVIKKPLNMLIELLNKFIGGINKIKVPEWIPVIGNKSVKIPEIPMLAKGTNYFKGGSAIVGEMGPELVTMPTGSKVLPADKTAQMLSGGEITINVPVMVDGREIARATAKHNGREQYRMNQQYQRGNI